MAKRKNLDDFQQLTRGFFNLIRANHHLEKVLRGPTELPTPKYLLQVKTWLSQTVHPASPNDHTALILNANAENWLQTALQTLMEHHSGTISDLKRTLAPLLEEDWEGPWQTAKRWIGKRFPHIKESLFQSTLEDLKNGAPYSPIAEPTPPPHKRPNTNSTSNQSPPCLGDQPDPHDQLEIPTSPLVTHGPPRVRTPNSSPDLFLWDSLSLPPGQLQGIVNDLLPPIIAPLPPITHGAEQTGLRIQIENPDLNKDTNADLNLKTNQSAIKHLPKCFVRLPLTTVGTPPGRSRPLSRSDFNLPPSPPLNQYTHHAHRGDKTKNWTLIPTRKTIIMGDSNIARLPTILEEGIQVDCFPGANLSQALHLLKHKTPTSDIAERVILSFGINDKHRSNTSLLDNSLRKLWLAARATFPHAQIHIPVINTSNSLSNTHRANINTLNQLIRATPDHIPRLSRDQFHTEADNIHWSVQTGRNMWIHWRSFLDQGFQHRLGHQ